MTEVKPLIRKKQKLSATSVPSSSKLIRPPSPPALPLPPLPPPQQKKNKTGKTRQRTYPTAKRPSYKSVPGQGHYQVGWPCNHCLFFLFCCSFSSDFGWRILWETSRRFSPWQLPPHLLYVRMLWLPSGPVLLRHNVRSSFLVFMSLDPMNVGYNRL